MPCITIHDLNHYITIHDLKITLKNVLFGTSVFVQYLQCPFTTYTWSSNIGIMTWLYNMQVALILKAKSFSTVKQFCRYVTDYLKSSTTCKDEVFY